jgi:hypothetical protein
VLCLRREGEATLSVIILNSRQKGEKEWILQALSAYKAVSYSGSRALVQACQL